jgi:nucleoside phosphorylase
VTETDSTDLDLSQATIGIITALPEEFAACKRVCDPQSLGKEAEHRATNGKLRCWGCKIPARGGGEHIVAITLLTDMGNNSAAIGANILLQHCQNIEYVLMCGIAGAVPCPTDSEKHVRLGDIVVSNSTGVIQYDRGKRHMVLPRNNSQNVTEVDPLDGYELRSQPRPPHPDLLNAVRAIDADNMVLSATHRRRWEQLIFDFLNSVDLTWIPPREDVLDDSHKDGPESPIEHPTGSRKRPIGRGRGRPTVPSPRVFVGPIASANTVLSDPQIRNALRERHSVRAVEMEASGVADAAWVAGVGYLIIRGTCDYCNSRKNDGWHQYAALVAAAYTRSLIENLYPIATTPRVLSGISLTHSSIASTQRRLKPATIPSNPLVSGAFSSTTTIESSVPIDSGSVEFKEQPIEARGIAKLQTHTAKDVIDLTLELQRVTEREDFSALPLAFDRLKSCVSQLPRRGREIRDAWDALYNAEMRRLRHSQSKGVLIDTSTLDECRKEAELVALPSD